MLRNRRGATSLRWLRALLDHGIEVHGQVVVCPGVNDGAVLDDTLAGVLDRYPELASLCVVPLGVSRYNTEPRHAAAHRGRGRARWSTPSRTGRTSSCAVLGRRLVFAADEYYLLAGRPFPAADAYEGFPMHEDGVGMARTFELEFAGAGRRRRPASQTGLLRLGRRRAGRGLPRPATRRRPVRRARRGRRLGRARRRAAPSRQAPVGILTGALRRAGAGAAASAALGRDDVRVVPVEQRVLRRQHRRHRPAGGRGPRPRPGRRARGPPLPAARRLPVRRPLPRRHRRPTTCPARSRSSPPTASPCARALTADRSAMTDGCPSSPSSGGPTSASRTLLNRIVGRRVAIVEEKPGRHPRPQGGRGRVAGRARSRWSTPAAGCPAAATSTPR